MRPKPKWWQRTLSRWLDKVELGRMIQRLGQDVDEFRDDTITKADGAEILAAVKSLRNDIFRPKLTITFGPPTDQET